MAAQHQTTLQHYLSIRPPRLTAVQLSKNESNTKNDAYVPEDIAPPAVWQQFNYQSMMNDFGPLLQAAMNIPIPPMPGNPQVITAEVGLRSAFDIYLKERLRMGLAFALAVGNRPAGHDLLDFGVGRLARCPKNFEPDGAFFEPGPIQAAAIKSRINRCPGDMKPSWKWKPSYPNHTNENYIEEGRRVLAQLNKYMNDNGTRYGYIMTDEYMVAVRKMDRQGHLQLSHSIPWHTPDGPHQFGALIALWYLGMLAARSNQWDDQHPPGVPPAQHVLLTAGHPGGPGGNIGPPKDDQGPSNTQHRYNTRSQDTPGRQRTASPHGVSSHKQQSAQHPTQQPVQHSTQHPIQHPTQHSAQQPTQRPTQRSIQHPVQHLTQPSAQPLFQRPTQTPTQHAPKNPGTNNISTNMAFRTKSSSQPSSIRPKTPVPPK